MPSASEERQEEATQALDPAVLAELRQLQGEGEPDIVQELAQAFQFETPPLLQALHQAIAEGQPKQLKRAAHNLKGSSNNLGARTMAALSTELEALGKNGTVEGAAELSTRLEHKYQAASGAIPAFPELCSAKFQFQVPSKAQELSVWLHRVTAQGQSENLPALLRVSSGKDIREFHIDGASKQFVLPLGNGGKKESGGRTGEFGQFEIEVQLAENTTRKK